MKANYHTHTTRCLHARGADEDYVKHAIAGGFSVLGFSDHSPWQYASDYVADMRMPLAQFAQYKESVLRLRKRYEGQIKILLGLEVEYFPQYLDWLKHFVHTEQLDYIIFGNHYARSDEYHIYYGTRCMEDEFVRRYAQDCVAGMETGLYTYLCHPDLFMRSERPFNEVCVQASYQICEQALRLGIPLEYNLEGLRWSRMHHVEQYPHHRFWEIAKAVGNTAIIGVDAHDPSALSDSLLWDEAVHYLDDVLQIKRAECLEIKGFGK